MDTTSETTAKSEATPTAARDELSAAPTTSPKPITGSNSDYLTNTTPSQPDAFNLTPSTPPDYERTVSTVTQPPSTLGTDLSTAPPTSTPARTAAHPVTIEDEEELDPKVASLLAIFPGFDPGVLQSILEVSGGDEDQAIETLLSMSDPEYKPSATAHQHNDQSDLDEQLARRLHLEEQAEADYEAHHGGSRPIPVSGRQSSPREQEGGTGGVDMGAIGAQVKGFLSGAAAKVSGSSFGRGGEGNVQRGGNVGSPPNVNTAEIKQQFNELAETGKKHFNTLMTKVKAKMQEYDIPGPGQQGAPQQGSDAAQSAGYGSFGQGDTAFGSQMAYGNQRRQQQQQQQEWYSQPVGTQPQPTVNPFVTQQRPQQTAVDLSVDPPGPIVPPTETRPPTRTTTSGSATVAPESLGVTQPGMQQRSSFDQAEAPRPTFDTSRLGLKPKRPVSLVGNSNATPLTDDAASKGKNKAEADDIEYVNEAGR